MLKYEMRKLNKSKRVSKIKVRNKVRRVRVRNKVRNKVRRVRVRRLIRS